MNRHKEIRAHIQKDAYAQQLGATLVELKPGYSCMTMAIQPEMVNFHGMTHGAVVFGLADVAFAAASNSRGQMALALNMTISFLKATQVGDRLQAIAKEQHQSGPTAVYDIVVTQQPSGELVAKLQAMVYRKKEWFVEP